ncbi:hypothetical protein V8E52_010616 [Russula decolorans]
MEFDPLLPVVPTPTPTPTPEPNVPPDIFLEPSISIPFPESTPYRASNNPFRGSASKRLSELHQTALQDALTSIRGPFLFNSEEPYAFNGACIEVDTSAESFNSAALMVIAALERGYFPNRDPTPLGTSDWARLSCDLLAAIGRGYHRQFTTDQETALERVRMQATDPSPLSNTYPTFFHRLSATAEQVAFHIGTDAEEQPEGYQDWYSTLKKDFTEKATKAAAAEVDEKWLTWKANEIDRLALTFKKDLGIKARERGTPTPTAGRKRTVSGSATETTQPMPTSTPQATRDSLPRAAKKTPSYSPAPRGRQLTPSPQPTATPPLPRDQRRKRAQSPWDQTKKETGPHSYHYPSPR